MMFKNVSDKDKNFMTKKGWLTLSPGESAVLPSIVGSLEEGLELVDETPTPFPEAKVIKNNSFLDKAPNKIFSRRELFDLKKHDQVNLLKMLGLSNKQISVLKKEDQRVKKILQLQDEN